MFKLQIMKNKLIIFDHQRLYLHCMHFLLVKNVNVKKFHILEITNFDDLTEHILEKDSVLILNLTGFNSVNITHQIENFLELNPSLKIIVHADNPDVRVIKKMFDKGVKSYLGSNTTNEEFIEALNQVILGMIYISDDTKNALVNSLYNADERNDKKRAGLEDITAREKDVLLLICDGLRSKEIAEKLFISTHTVESHRRNMMLKFNLNSSSKLVKFAMENRLVEY